MAGEIMRPIKFRAWDGKKMVYSGFVIYPENGACEYPEAGWDLQGYTEDNNTFKLMQFTGLQDKNGVDIYEGDVVHFFCTSGDMHWDMIEEIKWLHGAYRYGNFIPGATMPGCLRDHENQPWLEVIGNKYENPELVKA